MSLIKESKGYWRNRNGPIKETTMKILFVGESWVVHMIHTKGFDSFTSTKYEEGATYLLECLRSGGIEVDYMPSHEVQVRFPKKLEDLKSYDAIVLSDIGSNTFLLQNETFYQMNIVQNPLELIKEFVAEGGGFLMIGGYLSFTGVDAKARYKQTPIGEILPVELLDYDDRVEVPQGIRPTSLTNHPIIDGLDTEWPRFLGYNRFQVKSGAEEIVKIASDPFLVVGDYKKGKTAAFASDCSPHWGSLEFTGWKGYPELWVNLIRYISTR
jgi:uncharacterized membrane protein